LRSSHENQQ
jgi:hypothetical protein